jgi:hypothetical protein
MNDNNSTDGALDARLTNIELVLALLVDQVVPHRGARRHDLAREESVRAYLHASAAALVSSHQQGAPVSAANEHVTPSTVDVEVRGRG